MLESSGKSSEMATDDIVILCIVKADDVVSLGPHCVYFHMRKFKPQIEKVSTVCVEKIFALVTQHSERKLVRIVSVVIT